MRKLPDRAWWSWYSLRGEKRIRITLVDGGVKSFETLPRETTEREADRRIKILTTALDASDNKPPLDWDELIDAFLEDRRDRNCRDSTIDTYRTQIQSVARVLAGVDPLTLTPDHAKLYRKTMEADGLSAATIVRGLDAVSIVQRWCVERGWIQKATWQKVTRPEIVSERVWLHPEQVGPFLRAAARLSATPPGQARAEDWHTWEAAAWLLLHGLRTGELSRLLVRDIHMKSGVVYIVDRAKARTKTRASSRAFFIASEHARECLVRTFDGVPGNEFAFPITRSDGAGDRKKTKWFGRRCAATCAEAGIEPAVTPHGLRHTMATAAVIAGVDIHSLQAIMGHSDARVTANTYSHATSIQKSRVAGAAIGSWLDGAVTGKPTLRLVQ